MKFKKIKLFILLVFSVGIGFFIVATKGLKEVASTPINNVEIKFIKDGDYIGNYSKERWLSEVKVTVKDKEIKDIKLLSSPLTPEISDDLFKEIIKNQNIKIDVISGATATSKAYLKSVENALTN